MAYDFTALEFNDETFDREFGLSSPFNLGPNSYHLTTEMYPFLPLEVPWGFQQTFETSVLGRGSAETDLADYISSLPPRGPGHPRNQNQQNQEDSSAPRQFRCLEPGCSGLGWARPEHLRRHISIFHTSDRASFLCIFCNKSFNRRDNWLDHLYKHTQKRGDKTRIKFYPEAKDVYEHEMRKCSRRRKVHKNEEPRSKEQP